MAKAGRPPKKERNDKILKMREEGKSIYEIAKIEGISAPRVSQIINNWVLSTSSVDK